MLPLLVAGVLLAAPPLPAEDGGRNKDSLYAVSFVDARAGWAVGAFGTILSTRDGGRNWRTEPSHTTEPLFSVDFVDARHGWAVGRSGLILATADGGETWTRQNGGTDRHLFSVDFVDAQFGCAAGDWGTILVTNDGGSTWRQSALDRDVILNAVSMLDRSRGWIAGEGGVVLATGDGGVTWQDRPSGVEKTLFGVHFVDERRGWAVGLDGLILRTGDGGATWQVQNGSTEVGTLDQVVFAEAIENPSLYSVALAGERGIVVGESGAIFTTADAGGSWLRREVPPDWGLRWLRDVSLANGADGMIVGAEGRRIQVVNGSVTVAVEGKDAAAPLH